MVRINFIRLVALLFLTPIYSQAQDRVRIAVWGDSRENYLGACENITDYLLHKDTDWGFSDSYRRFFSRW